MSIFTLNAALSTIYASALITIAGTTAYLQIISGAQPASPDSVYGGSLLVAVPLANPIGTQAGGTITLTAANATITGTGTAAFARLTTSSGATTSVADFDVGTSSAFSVSLATTALVQNAILSLGPTLKLVP
jgi:hypothetical protein